MKLFENKVGRPSNETKKKRGIVYALLSLVLVIMLMMTSFMLNSAFSMEKVSGNIFDTIMNVVKSTIRNVFKHTKENEIVTVEIEDTSKDITKDKNNIYLVTKSGNYKPTVTIKIKATKDEEAEVYYKWFIYKDLNAKNLNWKDTCRVTTGIKTVNKNLEAITVNESSEYSKRSGQLKVYATKEACEKENDEWVYASKIINYKYLPKKKNTVTISLTDKSGLKSNNNVVYVNGTGDYSVVAKVTQSENANLYYRWDTYTGVNANKHSYTDTISHGNYTYCSSFKDKEITFNSLERLEYDDKNTPRSGKFSLYKNATDCKNGKNSVKSAVIGYQIGNPSTTTKSGSNGITIKLEDKGGKTKNSNNVVIVSSTGSYYVKATITKNDEKKLYYRWDTFNGLDAKTWKYSDPDNKCVAFSSKSTSLNSLESLDFYDENNPRSGRLSVYDSKSACDKDSKNTGKSALASAVIGYDYLSKSTNKGEYKTVKYDFKQIKNKFGKQAPSECYKAAMTYAAWIAQGIDRSDIMRHSTDYSRAEWGSNSYTDGGTTKNVYALIIERINAGKPVVVHGSCRDSYYWSHWVTVVGYKNGVKANNAKASDFLVIDPIEPKEKTLQEALPGGLGGNANFERVWW